MGSGATNQVGAQVTSSGMSHPNKLPPHCGPPTIVLTPPAVLPFTALPQGMDGHNRKPGCPLARGMGSQDIAQGQASTGLFLDGATPHPAPNHSWDLLCGSLALGHASSDTELTTSPTWASDNPNSCDC